MGGLHKSEQMVPSRTPLRLPRDVNAVVVVVTLLYQKAGRGETEEGEWMDGWRSAGGAAVVLSGVTVHRLFSFSFFLFFPLLISSRVMLSEGACRSAYVGWRGEVIWGGWKGGGKNRNL